MTDVRDARHYHVVRAAITLPHASRAWLRADGRTSNRGAVSFRLFSAVLIALALFLSPVARMSSGSTALAVELPDSASNADHCSGTGKHSGSEKPGLDVNCAAACAAVHATLPAVVGQVDAPRGRDIATVRPVLAGIFTEFDTPPPRA